MAAPKKFEEKWGAIQAGPAYQGATPRERKAMARDFAQLIARDEVPGNHPRMKAFLQEHVVGAKTRPSIRSTIGQGLQEGFDQTLGGMVVGAATGRPHQGPGIWQSLKDAGSNIASGANTLPVPSLPMAVRQMAKDPSVLYGTVGAGSAFAAQVPEAVAMGGLAGQAAKQIAKMGVKPVAAAAAGNIGVNAILGAGATKAAGGTNSDAVKAGAVMGLAGALPFAKHVPAGRLNPHVIPAPRPTIRTAPGPGRAPMVDMSRPSVRPATVDGYPIATVPESHRLPAAPAAAQAYPDWMTAGPSGEVQRPTGIAPALNGEIRVPPGGFRDHTTVQAGQRPAGRPDPFTPPRPADPFLALPPASSIQAGPANPEGLAAREWGQNFALDEQLGHRPGTTAGEAAPRDTFLQDASHEDLARWLAGYRGRLTAAKQNLTRLDNVVRADKQKRGGQSGIDETMMHEAHQDVQELPQRITELEAEITRRALRGEPFTEPPRRGRGAPPGRPTDAPAAPASGGTPTIGKRVKDAANRIIQEEDGSFNPVAALDTLDAAIGWTGGKVVEGYGAAKRGAIAAAKAVGPVARDLAAYEVKPRQWAEAAATKVGAGAVGQAFTKGQGHLLNTRARTPYPTLNDALNKPREFMFSDFGVPQQVKDWNREGIGYASEFVRPTRKLAIELDDRLTSAQQADAHMQASEPTYTGPVGPDAALAKAEAARVSDEMLAKGALDPTGHARWREHYIGPREFTKHLLNPLSKAAFARRSESLGMAGYKGRGTTELDANGAPVWRDYTIAERQKWGEVRHLSRSLDKLASHTEHDLRRAYTLDKIATPGAGDHLGVFAKPATPPAGMKMKDMPDTMTDPTTGQRYILLRDQAPIRGTKGQLVKRWGNLTDHYVRDDVYPYVFNRESDMKYLIDAVKAWTLQRPWKAAKTIGNPPGYFINNAMHNNPMLEASGGSVFDLPAAAAMLADDAPLVQAMRKGGWLRNDALAVELGARVRDAGLHSSAPHSGFSITKTISQAAEAWKDYEREAFAVSGATDDMYRVALVDGLMRREGMSMDDAARLADEAFYHPDNITSPAAQVASMAAPFARVFWYTSHALPAVASKNPGKAFYVYGMAALLPYVINRLVLGKDDDTIAAEQQAMPQHMRGRGNSFPLGQDANGNPLYQDRSNWNPGGAYSENVNVGAPWPLNMRGLGIGGPAGIAAQAYFGKDLFTGRDLVEKDAHGNVIEDGTNAFIARGLAPGVVNTAAGIADAAQGKTTVNGNRVTVPTAIARAAGFKVNPVDVAEAKRKEGGKTSASAREYTAQINRRQKMITQAYQNGNTGIIPQLEAEIEHLIQKRNAMYDSAAERRQTLDGYDVPDSTYEMPGGQETP